MKKVKTFITILVVLAVFGSFFYLILRRTVSDYLLRNHSVHAKAIVIDEKNYEPHSYVTHDFTYSYKLVVNGHEYTNNSHDQNARIGDSIEVEYVKGWPGFNRSLHPTD